MSDESWNAFSEAKPDDVLHQEGLGDPVQIKELTPGDLARRRLKACVERWPEAEMWAYDPRCCRFPKSCNPHGYIEAVEAGNLTEADLEP